MPGYRRQGTIFNLTFPEFEGLEVTTRGLSTGQMLMLWEANAESKSSAKDDAAKATRQMLQYFADALIKWNLESEKDDGSWEEVPATLEGIVSQDLPFVLRLIEVWTTVLAGVDANLGKDSDSGETSPDLNIPMEVS
jgi:hypothetical protein